MSMFEIYQPTYIPTLKMDWIFHFCIDFFVLPEENALCDKIVHTQVLSVVWYFRVRTIFREPSSLRSSNSAHEKVRTRKNRSTK